MRNESSMFTQEEWELMSIDDFNSLTDQTKYERLLKTLKRRHGIEFGEESTLEAVNKTYAIKGL